MFCTKCGSEVQEGTRFCTKCGAEITKMGMMQAETAGTEKQQQSNAQAGNKKPKLDQINIGIRLYNEDIKEVSEMQKIASDMFGDLVKFE